MNLRPQKKKINISEPINVDSRVYCFEMYLCSGRIRLSKSTAAMEDR